MSVARLVEDAIVLVFLREFGSSITRRRGFFREAWWRDTVSDGRSLGDGSLEYACHRSNLKISSSTHTGTASWTGTSS